MKVMFAGAQKLLDRYVEMRLRRRVTKLSAEQLLNEISNAGMQLQEYTRQLFGDPGDPAVLLEGQTALTVIINCWLELSRRANEV